MDLGEISEQIHTRLDAKHRAREQGLVASRQTIRACSTAIRAIHRGEYERAEELMGEAREALDDGVRALTPHPDVYYVGFLQDAQKEYAEARATYAIVRGQPLPTPEELKVGDAPYLNGLAEAIGEVRRHVLDLLRTEGHARGEELLAVVDDIYYVLVSMDYPDAMTGGLRRSTDVARSIMERTRGDFSLSEVHRQLEEALRRHEERLAGGGV
ncbi:MAG: haloacid dehalogenase [Actinomycetota bacterium]